MKLDILPIVKNEGGSLSINEIGKLDELESGLGNVFFDGPVAFQGTIKNNNGMLVLKGVAKTHYHTQCDRCGEKMDRELAVNVNEEIVKRADEESEEDAEAFNQERYTFGGNILELDGILTDSILLKVPMSHLCREECPGLCPECGAKKPAGIPQYRCDKCGWQPADPTKAPKFCPECGDPFDNGDIV